VQPKGKGLRAGDQFTVPLCRWKHHSETSANGVHHAGREADWWKALNIDPVMIAGRLWAETEKAMISQLHVTNDNGLVQTIATVESETGLTILSTGGGLADHTMHIPFAARDWLAKKMANDNAKKAKVA
jgi:hypothetical protein